uniref:3'(2'),5'-bisphosphate nucleotidase 1 n=1 Tax=Caligus rogercresseyi TaxID=217165 RepID=C1BNR8_CALRO|nr:32,5-bisphosphate nucleotidase 1 [Caligus rogercresseyi]
MSSSPLSDVLRLAVTAAEKGGQIVHEVFSSGKLGVVEKTDANDLQTLADRTVSDVLLLSFHKAFPDLKVISEEGKHYFDEALAQRHVVNLSESNTEYTLPKEFGNVTMDDLTVWIDPLDGTKEFADGFLERVTILIGIAVKGKSVAGVIHQPYYKGTEGRTLYGAIGGSIDKNFEKKPSPSEGKIIATTRSHSTKLVGQVIDELESTEVLRVGGAGYKVLMLLDGLAHAYVFPTPGCKKWDTCAPEAILHALGGCLTDIWGHSYNYDAQVEHVNQWGVIASCRDSDHENLISQIPSHLKEEVKNAFKKK